MPHMRVILEQSGPNEVFAGDGAPRELYRPVLDELERVAVGEGEERTRRAQERVLAEQHGFGILEGDKTHPTDWFPRVLPAAEWETLERGLAQRLRAINEFLRRLEAGKEEVVPREVIETSTLYDTSIPHRFGEVPVRQVGIDLVAVEEGGSWKYLIIEDNARMPVGAMSMSRLRTLTPDVFPDSYAALRVRPLGDLLGRLGDVLRAASPLRPDARHPLNGPRGPVLPRSQPLRRTNGCYPRRATRGRARRRGVPGPQGKRPKDRRCLRAHRGWQDLRRPSQAHPVSPRRQGQCHF